MARPKGSKNKTLRGAIDARLRQKYPNYDPVLALAEIAVKRPSKHWKAEQILKARVELIQYVEPKLRSVETKLEVENKGFTLKMIHPKDD